MALRKIYIPNSVSLKAGFSLIEVLLVLAIVGVLLSGTLFFTNNYYRDTALQNERQLLISLLYTTRADAMNNIEGMPHGVAFFPDGFSGYVLFSGNDYELSDISTRKMMPIDYPVTLAASSPAFITFKQLSGDASYSGELILIDSNRSDATTGIIINYAGKIGW